jgi:hypothetical protein
LNPSHQIIVRLNNRYNQNGEDPVLHDSIELPIELSPRALRSQNQWGSIGSLWIFYTNPVMKAPRAPELCWNPTLFSREFQQELELTVILNVMGFNRESIE